MHVGVCQIKVYLPGSRSLKDRRRIVRSLCDRLRHRFGVSAAEVGGQDRWQTAAIAVAAVSGDPAQSEAVLNRVVDYVEERLYDAQIVDCEIQVVDMD